MQRLMRLLYPPQCLSCDRQVVSDFGLCGQCWSETPFIFGLVCQSCGTPLPGEDPGYALECDACLERPRLWQGGRAALVYKGRGRGFVLSLKRGDRLDLPRSFAPWMLRAARPLLKPDTLIVPIPLHWRRLLERRYNQSALLSRALARLSGYEHCPDLLQRHRRTPSQEGHDKEARFQNLEGSMRLSRTGRRRAKGRHILLVDDVMTSGATFSAAAEACLAGGAAQISTLSLSRAVKDM